MWSSSRGRLVVVGGEAGVGKTALLRAFCEAQARDARILWGACERLRTPRPLGPLIDVGDAAGGELRELLMRAARPYEVAAALLDELRGGRSKVLVLEDVHWADEAPLDAWMAMAARVGSVPALVLASYRSDALGGSPQLRFVLGELVRGPNRLSVAPLSEAGVIELAEPHGIDGRELYRRTGGNPFFVTEVLAAGGEQLPQTVRDAVLARAVRLSAAARELLDAPRSFPGRSSCGCWRRWLARFILDSMNAWLGGAGRRPGACFVPARAGPVGDRGGDHAQSPAGAASRRGPSAGCPRRRGS